MNHPLKPVKHAPSSGQKWQKPILGLLKCNVDAAFFVGNSTGATGLVLRGHDGRALGGWSKWYEHCLDPLITEALACHDGLEFAQKCGVKKIIVETDCQVAVLVHLWENHTSQRSEVDPILFHIAELSRSFEVFRLCFAHRTCNRLAHVCARLVSRDNPVEEWLIIPPGLRDTYKEDCNSSHE